MGGVTALGSCQPGLTPAASFETASSGDPLDDFASASSGTTCGPPVTSPTYFGPGSDDASDELPGDAGPSGHAQGGGGGGGGGRLLLFQTPPKQHTPPSAGQDEASPSWTEKSPLRALWKWGSGMSGSDAADIADEISSSMEMGRLPGDGAAEHAAAGRPSVIQTAPCSSLRRSSNSPVRRMPPLQVRAPLADTNNRCGNLCTAWSLLAARLPVSPSWNGTH